MNGADVLVRSLQSLGVRFVPTLSGNGLNPFYEACRQGGLRLVDFRTEASAAFAGDAAARLTRRLAVCAVSSAVGHVNALIGVLNAYFDGAPLLLISGASPRERSDMGKFQEVDQIALATPICKYARLVERADRIPFYVQQACAYATSGRPGPVHLTIPSDVLAAEVTGPHPLAPSPTSLERGKAFSGGGDPSPLPPLWGRGGGWGASPGLAAPRAVPDAGLIDAVVDLLAASERPMLVAGSGAFYAGAAEELEAFGRATAVPVVVPIWDRGVVDRPAEHFVGLVGAASGEPRLLPEADLILLVGARIDYRVGYGESPGLSPEARVVRIDVEPGELRQGRDPDVALLADPASALAALTAAAARRGLAPKRAWLSEARRRAEEFRQPWSGPLPSDPPITGRHVVEALRPLVADEALFLVDGGNIGQWAHVALGADRYPGDWLTCGASGVVGWGVAGGIAAKLAFPDRPVVVLSGDGAIGFGLVELETAVRHNAPFVVVLADDRGWGSVVSGQRHRYGSEGVVASLLGPVDYTGVAAALGATGIRIERADEIGPAVARGLASGRPTLVHVPVAPGGPGET